MNFHLKPILFLLTAVFFIAPNLAWAANCPTHDVTLGTKTIKSLTVIEVKVSIPGVTHECTNPITNKVITYVDDLPTFAGDLYKFLVGIAAIAALIMLMFGGYTWLFAGGNSGKIGEAKEIIISSAFGLTLALGSFMIASLINPNLVKLPDITNDIKTPSISSAPKVTRICDINNYQNAIQKNSDFGCGSIYYKNYDAYKDCLQQNKNDASKCKTQADVAYKDGCMDITCIQGISSTKRICSISSDPKTGEFIGGSCISTVTANFVDEAGKLKYSDSFKISDDSQSCGTAGTTGQNVVSNKCGSSDLNTCTVIHDGKPIFKARFGSDSIIQFQTGILGGNYMGKFYETSCRNNLLDHLNQASLP